MLFSGVASVLPICVLEESPFKMGPGAQIFQIAMFYISNLPQYLERCPVYKQAGSSDSKTHGSG